MKTKYVLMMGLLSSFAVNVQATEMDDNAQQILVPDYFPQVIDEGEIMGFGQQLLQQIAAYCDENHYDLNQVLTGVAIGVMSAASYLAAEVTGSAEDTEELIAASLEYGKDLLEKYFPVERSLK